MVNPGKKPILGILGGVCSGKSTVAVEFAKLGCKIIDADGIAHELLNRADIKEKVIEQLGPGILGPSGKIDRRKLGEIAFGSSEKLSALNGILHPYVLAQIEELIEQYKKEADVAAVVLDMPLLVEVGWAKRCDRLIFVDCEESLRAERAKKKGLFDENQIKIRENFQISLDNKASIADNTINNNLDFSALVKQVSEIFSCIINSK